jgi:CRISPR-associated protein Cas2
MYVLLVYDIGQARVGKMLKLCRRYLNWIQNSVFEGEITEVGLKELLAHADKFLRKEEDSVLIFKAKAQKWLEKQVVGRERNPLDTFL